MLIPFLKDLMPKISLVIPCYFNEQNIPVTFKELIRTQALFPVGTQFEYIFVDDGSKDQTYEELLKCRQAYGHAVKVIKLAKNVGSYTAIFAGLHYATGDCQVILAADLQDPPALIADMYSYWNEKKIKLVLAHRTDRLESWTRKLVSNTFHFLFKTFAIKQAPNQGFDMVLFDKLLTQELLQMNESGLHVHYSLLSLGFPFISIPYVRQKRELGESQWTFSKKIKLFIDSFVGFSYAPIRAISIIGIIFSIASMSYLAVILIHYFFWSAPLQGWSSLMAVLLLVASFQFLALGILGEYLWRTLDTVRKRPKYVLDQQHLD